MLYPFSGKFREIYTSTQVCKARVTFEAHNKSDALHN